MTAFERSLILQIRRYFEDDSTNHYKRAAQYFPKLTHNIKTLQLSYKTPVVVDVYIFLRFLAILTAYCGRLPPYIHNCIVLGATNSYELDHYMREYKKYD
jgi:hypothetical protein